MLKEVSANKTLYSTLQGGKQWIEKIIQSIQVESLNSKIGSEKWLSKFDHGQILANLYGRPLIFISLVSCSTFLPLTHGPSSTNTDPVYLLHINQNNWVLGNVEAEDGTKPIPPPILAPRNTSEGARKWYNHIQRGRDLYEANANEKN